MCIKLPLPCFHVVSKNILYFKHIITLAQTWLTKKSMLTADPTPTTNVIRVIRMVAGIRVTIQNETHLSTLQCMH